MAKKTVLAKKKRGPPATGKGVQVVVRMQPAPLAALDSWAAAQQDKPTRPEALRRLFELGLTVGKRNASSTAQRDRAAQLAGNQIDRLGDETATSQQKADRKRRLISGPSAFRNSRMDRSTPKK